MSKKFAIIKTTETIIIPEGQTSCLAINDILPKKIICAGTLILKNNIDQDAEDSFIIQLSTNASFTLASGSSLFGIETLFNKSNTHDLEIDILGYNFTIHKEQKAFDLQQLWHLSEQEINALCDFIKNDNIKASPPKLKISYRNNVEIFNKLFEKILTIEQLNNAASQISKIYGAKSEHRKQSIFWQELNNTSGENDNDLLGLTIKEESEES